MQCEEATPLHPCWPTFLEAVYGSLAIVNSWTFPAATLGSCIASGQFFTAHFYLGVDKSSEITFIDADIGVWPLLFSSTKASESSSGPNLFVIHGSIESWSWMQMVCIKLFPKWSVRFLTKADSKSLRLLTCMKTNRQDCKEYFWLCKLGLLPGSQGFLSWPVGRFLWSSLESAGLYSAWCQHLHWVWRMAWMHCVGNEKLSHWGSICLHWPSCYRASL